MAKVTFDYSKAASFVSEEEVQSMSKIAESAKELLLSGEGAGNDFLGWVDLPVNYDKEEFERIKKAAQKIQSDSDVLLVIGIGGSYLGARAANEFLNHNFFNCLTKEQRKAPEIYYVGNSISSTYVSQLRDVLKDKDFSVNIISKSGTTTEPAIAFRIFKKMLEEKYGSKELIQIIGLTAVITALVNYLFFWNVGLCGASGVVFAFIILASFTGFKEGEIPLTFLLVAVIFIGQQVYEAITVTDDISNMAHIVGGAVGALLGYGLNKNTGRYGRSI